MPREPDMRRSPEFDLIAAIRERLQGAGTAGPLIGIGDDAAVTVPSGATATSVDAVVEGVHFRRRWSPLPAIGHRALAAALSDIAAMGARAGEAYVWLGLPDELGEDEALEICDGLAACAERFGVAVLGGDLTRAPTLALCVTVVGHTAAPEAMVGRSGAADGQVVCLTGSLGGATAGLLLLEDPALAERIAEPTRRGLIEARLWPAPRLAVGEALAAAGAVAMIDVSDGLGADLEQLAAASGVGIEVEAEAVPLADGLEQLASAAGRDAFGLAQGGEDYELLCVLAGERVAAARKALASLGCDLAEIGRVVSGDRVRIRLADGRSLPTLGHDQLRR